MDSLFKGAAGHRAFSPDTPLPAPPVGLPPGIARGRVMHQNGYIEYADGAVAGAGFFKQEQPGYNSFQREVRHTVSALSREAIAESSRMNHPLLAAPSVELDIVFPTQNNGSTSTKTVRLIDAPKTHEVGDVLALDSSVLVDHVFKLVADPAHQSLNWNVDDLRDAKLRLVLRFFFIEGISSLPPESWPALHNFQLWLGPRADRVFSLDPPRLTSQRVRRDPNPIAGGQAQCVELLYETAIDEGAYAKCFLAAA
ncbi:MAG: hypothetical protein ACYDC8_13880 [Gammaproteobacteria bacterium]